MRLPSTAALIAAVVGPVPATPAQDVRTAAQQTARADTVLPLTPQRRLRFTTREGTWMSLDVSPDGRTIVFDLLGDLYTVPVTGGAARRLTSGLAFDGQPRFSPDGRSIVFVSDRNGSDNVWIANSDGTSPRPVTRDERRTFISPEWTPDGEFVVVSKSTEIVSRPRSFQLVMYHRAGGSGVPLTGPTTPPAPAAEGEPRIQIHLGAAFGNDARQLYVTVSAGGGGYGNWQIAQLDRGNSRVYQRTHEIAGALRPVVSPDGAWLVYGTRVDGTSALKLVDLKSGDERWLVRRIDRDDQEGSFTRDLLPGASFTPDSRSLIAAYGGQIHRIAIPEGADEVIPFSADVDLEMGALAQFEYPIADSVVTARRIENPRLSPDGRRLVFSSLGRIWLQELPSGVAAGALPAPRRLNQGNDGAYFPTWSPDGQHVAWVSWNDLEGGDVWRTRADGTARPERLTTQRAFYERLAYTPDGTRLVVARGPRHQRTQFFDELRTGRPQVREIVWLPASGGATTVIAPVSTATRWASMHYGIPHFTNDTTRVFFMDPVEGLVSVRWDGSERRTVLRVQGWEWTRNPPVLADEILLSPDGKRALALLNSNVWVLDVPTAGDRLPTVFLPPTGAAPLPARRLTSVGADYVAWRHDGAAAHWAIGNAFFAHDVSDAQSPAQRAARVDISVRMPREIPSGSLVLRGARVITMRGTEVIENADVVVTDSRIVGVGARGSVRVPPGAREIDVTGKTLLPGYVDIHAHMWAPWGVHRNQVWEYLANLAFGVTATRDPQTMTADVISYADRVAVGDITGPRIYSTARGIFPSEDIKSLDDARDVLRRYSDHYKTETIKNYLVGDRKHRQWLVQAAHELRLTPTAEATSDFRMNLTLAIDGYAGLEHSLPLTTLHGDVVRLLAESRMVYTPTLLINYGGPAAENLEYRASEIHDDAKLRRFLPHEELDRRTLRRPLLAHANQFIVRDVSAQAAKILAAGGRVGLGAHGQLQGMCVHWELWNFAAGGMKPHDILRVATISGAEAIGHGKDFGSIEVGKLADLQVLDRNPLEDIRNSTSIRYVMINGRLFDANTMDEVWPRAKPLDRQWWITTEPQ
jgi:imidazolonepropionase-like amidohydrolase/Tol biopolymer transport system component